MKRTSLVEAPRSRSPRAPSIALDEAVERVLKAYEKDRLHPAPTDVVAQHIGYKGASNGAALSALASLRYYGLLERPREGLLAVTKDVEAYKFAPGDDLRQALLRNFVRRPPLFADLLDKYASGLPSDANLRYDLIQRGFIPATAGSVVAILKRSAEFARYFDGAAEKAQDFESELQQEAEDDDHSDSFSPPPTSQLASRHAVVAEPSEDSANDKIPVRLQGGRRAWLVIPTPFYEADKQRLKAQIDLLFVEEGPDSIA